MPLLWLSIAFLTGILLANAVRLSVAGWLILAGAAFTGSILIAILSRWLAQRVSLRPRAIQSLPYPFSPAFLVLLLAAGFLGASRYQAKQPDLSDPGFIAWYNSVQDKVLLEGVIVEPPDVRDTYTYLRLAAEKNTSGKRFHASISSSAWFGARHGLSRRDLALWRPGAPGRADRDPSWE
jgi:hypothetical protein